MNPIEQKIYSFYQVVEYKFRGPHELKWEKGATSNGKIRECEGYQVKRFKKLVELTALLGLQNRQFDLFYRGQIDDYKDKNGKSIIYPNICRPEKKSDGSYKASIRTKTIEDRFDRLHTYIDFRSKARRKIDNIRHIQFHEYDYALIQHYELLPTPLVDITQSLRVAASFALDNSKSGYLYVFGLPYPHGSISHFIDFNMVLVKLQSACPANALRPRYQEGFLIGRLPFSPYKSSGDNVARRLIGKFFLDNTDNSFWDDLFPKLPKKLLFPENDQWESSMKESFDRFNSTNSEK